MPSNTPPQTSPVFCTDEDIAVRAGSYFVTLVPAWQLMAGGTDGVFTDGLPWILSSATTDFEANGVQPNHVVQLSQGTPTGYFRGGGQLLAVDSVSGNTVTLRRLHKDLNVGQPPSPAGGMTVVTFVIATLDPQIEEASFDIKRRFGIDETIVYRSSSWIFDLRDLRMATILLVLLDRYAAENQANDVTFMHKIQTAQNELASVMDRVEVRWGAQGNLEEPSTIFNTRLSR
jgi:hypothetical protein